MARYQVDRAAIERVPTLASVDSQVRDLAETIRDESRANVTSMSVVDTGAMRDSAFSDGADSAYRVGYTVEYAPYVHEGTGRVAPVPFLSSAALKNRGRLG